MRRARRVGEVLLWGIGCGGEGSAAPAGDAQAPPAADARAAVEPAAGRDLGALDLCALLPADEVAAALDGRIEQPASSEDYGQFRGCTYGLRPAAGRFEFVAVRLQPPATFEGSEAALETARGLGHEAAAQPVDGLADEAFAVENRTEDQWTVHALRRSDLAVEVTAASLEHARLLAEKVLERTAEGAPAAR